MSQNFAPPNSFDIPPDFGSTVPPGSESVPQPSAQPPQSAEEERNLLWRTIYSLATNFDTFSNRQSREYEDNRFAMQAIVNELSNIRRTTDSSTSGSGAAPRVREPRMFNGNANQVDPFIREITHALVLQRRSIVTDHDKCLYLGFYLADGSPTAWYTSVEKNRPHIMQDFTTFLGAFKEHFEDSDRYATALAKLRKLKQAPGSAANYASRFRELAWELDLTDQTVIQMYYDGLKDDVKDAITLVTVDKLPSHFDDYVKMVITLDNKLHRRKLERRHGASTSVPDDDTVSPSPSPEPASSEPTSHSPFNPPLPSPFIPSFTTPSPPSTSLNDDVVPMEIDAIRHGSIVSAELKRRRAEGLCDYCGRGKHQILNCPNMSDAAKQKYQLLLSKT